MYPVCAPAIDAVTSSANKQGKMNRTFIGLDLRAVSTDASRGEARDESVVQNFVRRGNVLEIEAKT